jgi:hypothetical protein
MLEMTIKFETGNTYSTRSPCDHDTVISISVLSRTTKTIKTACGKTLRVAEYEGHETVKPWGSYSMAPIIKAKLVPTDGIEPASDELIGADFEELFDIEERAALLGVACSALSAAPAPHNTAKLYHFADYRK